MNQSSNHRQDLKTILEAKELVVGYHKMRPVSAPVSFSLRSGDFCCLTGPNGSGKTTLMKTLSGFLKPLSGAVVLNEKPLSLYTFRQLAGQLSIVLTERPEMDRTTVAEVVGMGRQPYTGISGRLHARDREVVLRSLKQVGMEEFRDQYFGRLSDGEKQKTMIAKTLAQETPLILLDEPAAFLDFPGRSDIMYLLRNLAHSGKLTVLVSTHDVSLAFRLADKIFMMAPGKPFRCDIPEILMEERQIPAYFNHQGMQFDENICEFIPDVSQRKKILIEGSSVLLPVIRNLIFRKGLHPVTEGEAPLQISAWKQNHITLRSNDTTVQFPGISFLNEYIDNELLKKNK